MSAPQPLLQVRGLNKAYAGPVLIDFDFELRTGEFHVLVGANGAGKSTFVRMLTGLARPDAGTMLLERNAYHPRSRREAEAVGVVIVLQELNILPTLTIAENLFLDRLPRKFGLIDRPRLRAMARTALERVGMGALDPDTPASSLGVGEHQLLEIAAALDRRCRVLILDEPTAALTAPEIDRLFAHLETLRRSGLGIIHITHRMNEIRRLGGRVSVLRDGRRITTLDSATTHPTELLRAMSGEAAAAPHAPTAPATTGAIALRVENLRSGNRLLDASFTARRGEVLGIAGLVGSGRTELLRTIYGADRATSGRIWLGDATEPASITSPSRAVRLGLGLIPEERKKDGLLLSLNLAANTALAVLPRLARARTYLPERRLRLSVDPVCDQLAVVRASLDQSAAELSGGNQQKLILARWLLRDCEVLLVDEPTRGIDTPSKARVHRLLRELAARGKAVVVVSSETSELFSLCDRLLVMSAGRIATELPRESWSEAEVLRASFSGYLHAS